jgi:hypothetical protein
MALTVLQYLLLQLLFGIVSSGQPVPKSILAIGLTHIVCCRYNGSTNANGHNIAGHAGNAKLDTLRFSLSVLQRGID